MATTTDIFVNKKKITRNVNLVGGKAQNLAALSLAGFNVPDFFVVTTAAYQKHLSHKKRRFKDQLARIIERLNPENETQLVARSSSPLEDHILHSFAGQFESYLHLNNHKVYQAIERVWESAFQKNVKEYVKSQSVEEKRGIAVVVQKMVQAHVSGVLFTRHPIEDQMDSMLIEMVDGGCDALVSGKKHPYSLTIYKNMPDDFDGVAEYPDNIKNFIFNKNGLQELLTLGQNIERLFGSPQDIEWAYDGNDIWILQSRPISTLQAENPAIYIDKNGAKWSSYFFAERFMQPLSPLGWSFLAPIIRKTALQDPLWFLGYDKAAKTAQLKLINGLPFANLDAYRKIYSHIPLNLISDDKRLALELDRLTQKRITFRNIFSIFNRLIFNDIGWFPPANLWQWRKFSNRMNSITTAMLDTFDEIDANTSFRVFEKTFQWSKQFLKIHRWSITFADIFTAVLEKYLTILHVTDSIKFENLLSGLPENATVQANLALYNLDVESKSAMTKFSREFGHRSESLDIACHTWGEDKTSIFKMAKTLQSGKSTFIEHQIQIREDRQITKQQIQKMIRNKYPFSGVLLILLFRILLYYAQQFMSLRENQRNLWHKILRVSRYSVLKIARTFVKENIIKEEEDIFYLGRKEIGELVTKTVPKSNIKSLIAHRKKVIQKVQLREKEDGHEIFSSEKMRMTMNGIGVSAGKTKGRARIALNYAEAMQSQPGDILIVRSADPAWSPIFAVVSGLVMERGGVLSHASIVAREFRLPTITSVANATQKIANGDLLEIDGRNGQLVLLSE